MSNTELKENIENTVGTSTSFMPHLNWSSIHAEFLRFVRKSKGAECPCCKQHAKEYKRRLNSSIAAGLVVLSKMDHGTFHHVREILERLKATTVGRDFALLKYWGLIEEQYNEDTGKRSSGMWRITEKGVRFANGEIKVPRHIFLYAGRETGRSFEETTIFEALGDKFNYSEL